MASKSAKEVAVKVTLRVRPLLEAEKLQGREECVHVVSDKRVVLGNENQFSFHRIIPPNASQAEVYQQCALPLVGRFLQGFNTTILTYGQTGSGKTFTLGSGPEVDVDSTERGVIPRTLESIFAAVKDLHPPESCTLAVSYIEVYKDDLRDLLSDGTASRRIQLREQENGNIVVYGLSEASVSTVRAALQCLRTGNANRITGATRMNKRSSRSHAIFTIRAEIVQHVPSSLAAPDNTSPASGSRTPLHTKSTDATAQGILRKIYPKFNFVDLAGSERYGQTGNEGNRFKESIHINSGLLALGNVINALGESRRKPQHIPYRDSKITRLLKDSLGGNAKTVMLACVGPAVSNYAETLSTLKYAQRASLIRNKPVMVCSEAGHGDDVEVMKNEIQALKEELQRTRSIAPPPSAMSGETFVLTHTEEEEGGEEEGGGDVWKRKIMSLEDELAQCRIDLATDEDMFADKVQQIEKCQEQVEILTIKNVDLAQSLEEAKHRGRKLSSQVESLSNAISVLRDELQQTKKAVRENQTAPSRNVVLQTTSSQTCTLSSPPSSAASCIQGRKKIDLSLEGILSALESRNEKLAKLSIGTVQMEHVQLRNGELSIENELEMIISRKKALDQLEKDLGHRETALAQREAIVTERDILDAKKLRASHILHKQQTRVSVRLSSLEQSIRAQQVGAGSGGDSDGPGEGTPRHHHLAELRKERNRLLLQQNSLRKKIDSEEFLSADEERRFVEVTEWLEAVESAIHYQDRLISTRQNQSTLSVEIQGGGSSSLLRKLEVLPPPVTRQLFAKYLEKMIQLRLRVEEEAHSNQEMKILLKEKEEVVLTLERCLLHTRSEIRRKVALVEEEHKKEMRVLLSSSSSSTDGAQHQQTHRLLESRVQELERELYYYKKTSRDLKHQLRRSLHHQPPPPPNPSPRDHRHTSTSSSHSVVSSAAGGDDRGTGPSRSSTASRTGLGRGEGREEGKGVAVVKKSKAQLRQLSSEEVSRRVKATVN